MCRIHSGYHRSQLSVPETYADPGVHSLAQDRGGKAQLGEDWAFCILLPLYNKKIKLSGSRDRPSASRKSTMASGWSVLGITISAMLLLLLGLVSWPEKRPCMRGQPRHRNEGA
jgi:hypothetical protein